MKIMVFLVMMPDTLQIGTSVLEESAATIAWVTTYQTTQSHTKETIIPVTLTFLKLKTEVRGPSQRVNYTDQATAACRRS
jgi:hypothetical protein